MSMICFCQANVDLSEYGLRNAHAIGMTCANEIINVLYFSNHSWSNDIFGILWDNSINEMNPLLQNKSFLSTPIFSFLNSVTDYCEKIAIFHCMPSPNNSDWSYFESKYDFYKAVEDALKIGVPYTGSKTLIYNNVLMR